MQFELSVMRYGGRSGRRCEQRIRNSERWVINLISQVEI